MTNTMTNDERKAALITLMGEHTLAHYAHIARIDSMDATGYVVGFPETGMYVDPDHEMAVGLPLARTYNSRMNAQAMAQATKTKAGEQAAYYTVAQAKAMSKFKAQQGLDGMAKMVIAELEKL